MFHPVVAIAEPDNLVFFDNTVGLHRIVGYDLDNGIALDSGHEQDATFAVAIELFVVVVASVKNIECAGFVNHQSVHLASVRLLGRSEDHLVRNTVSVSEPESQVSLDPRFGFPKL